MAGSSALFFTESVAAVGKIFVDGSEVWACNVTSHDTAKKHAAERNRAALRNMVFLLSDLVLMSI